MATTRSGQSPTLEQKLTEDDFATDDLQELRLALVMTGGVSLAVWMGGVAHELNRLVRGDDETYVELLRLTRALPRIDVIAGTSAGGLNGALLAYAITQRSPVEKLRRLWLELGAMEELLRNPTVANPPSLLRGDDYFLPEIRSAINELTDQPTEPAEAPMELMITTTLLNAWPRGIPDSFGTIIQDADHHGLFTFRRGIGQESDTDGGGVRDDFAAPDIDHRLALAARCTASFPIAFEASYVPIGDSTAKPVRRDMGTHANFERSRWAIDGGVLLNQPLRPALRAIFRQPADRQVRRVLAYVVPDPGEGVQVEPDDLSDVPTLTGVGVASLMRLPRNQSVGAELDELVQNNRRVDAQRRQRELMVGQLDVDAIAENVYEQYRGIRAEAIAGWLFDLLAHGFSGLEMSKPDLVGEAPLRERARLREQLVRHLRTLPPERFPSADDEAEDWFTTRDTAERAASVLLDLLRRGLTATDPADETARSARQRIQRLRQEVSELVVQAQRMRRPLKNEDELELAEAAVLALRERRLADWANEALPRLLGDRQKLRTLVVELAERLVPAAEAVMEACAPPRPAHLEPRAVETAEYARGIVEGVPERSPALRRLLALEVVQLALGSEATVEQRVDLIQVSGDAGNGLDPRERAGQKLAGLQLGHFGAFYKRSWRANDWMWGRHDAVQRLVQVLIDPARLRQLGYSAQGARDEIERTAFGGLSPEDEDLLRTAGPRPWNPDKADEELGFLDDPTSTPPAALPMCAQAVARRLQLGIVRDELRHVSDAIDWDEKDGAHMPTAARDFRDQLEASADPLPAKRAVELFNRCKVGQELIGNETGSDLLARTATRSAAVTTAAASGEGGGMPKLVAGPLRTLRGLALMIFLFVRHALAGQRAGALLATGALFAGAALLGVGLLVDIPGVLMVIGLGLLMGAITLALLRGKLLRLLWALVLGFLIGISPTVADWIIDSEQLSDWVDRVQPIVAVLGLLVAAYLLGRMSVEWPERADEEPDEA
jgi:patatin-related protein